MSPKWERTQRLLTALGLHRHEFWGQMDSKEGRRKEIIRIGRGMNEIENKSKTERTNKAKSYLFEMV